MSAGGLSSAEKGIDMKFYLIDAESENYFVGQIERDPDQVKPEIAELPIGGTWWNPDNPRKGLERFA